MKVSNSQSKAYTCLHCKKTNEVIGVVQKETHYYSLNLETKQWKDFHGDESVESQELFCLNCKKEISDEEVDF
jgi:DNA-directed RNA polymerase subunit RPC12/RpoP